LKLVPVDDGKAENGRAADHPPNGSQWCYQPLSRPLFIYVAKKAAERPEFRNSWTPLARRHPRSRLRRAAPEIYDLAKKHFAERKVSGVRRGGSGRLTLEQLLTRALTVRASGSATSRDEAVSSSSVGTVWLCTALDHDRHHRRPDCETAAS
jgi:hypothetical protein